ncbi:unnamed protein product, partial [Cyprideis torosa]
MLNLTADHLERHGTLENYAGIKERLIAASDLAVVGQDDEHCRAMTARLTASQVPTVTVSSRTNSTADIHFDGSGITVEASDVHISLETIGSLRGWHNGQNAAAAFAACEAIGLSASEIECGFKSFPGLEHRMEQVGHVGRVLFINDSKATNAEAASPALASFEKVFWIAGGLGKSGGIESLAPQFDRIEKAFFIGEAAGTFASQLSDTIPYEISGTLKQAVNHALAAAEKSNHPVVLLSPAAASFDQFPNFEKRGEAFKAE